MITTLKFNLSGIYYLFHLVGFYMVYFLNCARGVKLYTEFKQVIPEY